MSLRSGDRFIHFLLIAPEQFAAEAETVVQAECLTEVGKILLFEQVAQEYALFSVVMGL